MAWTLACIVGQGVIVAVGVLCYRRIGTWHRASSASERAARAAMQAGLLQHRSNMELTIELKLLRDDVRLKNTMDLERHVANFVHVDEEKSA